VFGKEFLKGSKALKNTESIELYPLKVDSINFREKMPM